MARVQSWFTDILRWFDSEVGSDQLDLTSRRFSFIRVLPFVSLHLACLLAFLTGFMATALIKLWPWQAAQSETIAEAHDVFALLQWPSQYAANGNEAFLALSILACLVGGAGICLLSKLSTQ